MATLAHGGRTLATYDIVVTDAAGHRVCTSRLTCLIGDQVPGLTETALIIWGNAELSEDDHRAVPPFAPRGGGSLTWGRQAPGGSSR